MKSKVMVVAMGVVLVVVTATTALAGHMPSGVKSYTGCLVPKDGVIIKVKEGNSPASACTGGSTQVHLSGGDITKISVSGALSGGGDNGEVTIGLKPEFTLPTGCSNGQVAKWQSGTGTWVCAADNDTTYAAGTGLDLNGSEISIEESYRLPQTCASGEAATRNPAAGGSAPTWICDQFAQAEQACSSGQFATGVTALGTLSCAAPGSSGGMQAFSASTNGVVLAGRTSVLSKTLPSGKYVVFASVELVNRDVDSTSVGSCDLSHPGGTIYLTGIHSVDEGADYESLSLTGAFEHGTGAILLACTETQADVDVQTATLVAIKVDSIG